MLLWRAEFAIFLRTSARCQYIFCWPRLCVARPGRPGFFFSFFFPPFPRSCPIYLLCYVMFLLPFCSTRDHTPDRPCTRTPSSPLAMSLINYYFFLKNKKNQFAALSAGFNNFSTYSQQHSSMCTERHASNEKKINKKKTTAEKIQSLSLFLLLKTNSKFKKCFSEKIFCWQAPIFTGKSIETHVSGISMLRSQLFCESAIVLVTKFIGIYI